VFENIKHGKIFEPEVDVVREQFRMLLLNNEDLIGLYMPHILLCL